MEPTITPSSDDFNADRRSGAQGRAPRSNFLLDEFGAILNDETQTDIESLKARLRERLDEAREAFSDAADSTNDYVREAMDCAEDCIRERPWHSLACAAGAAFILGLIVGRR